ncbi:MAG TPA: response regulator [Steroidobacteraceae bacterium]|jgi:CheY-like chemotaxis protein
MGAKRALIVDDSRSARLFLARMLEKYEIDVDSAESAEAAIEYLGSHRPDVIFMDHLMPGMDGFQAVQAIKNNPRTATIPIMMYTSQEGELYLGQARALGAVGVLPKQIKPTDVSKVLYQLHLVADRRTAEQTSFRPVAVPQSEVSIEEEAAAPSSNPTVVVPKALTDSALREHFAELRRALVAGIDTQTDRITAEVRAILLEALPPQASEYDAAPRGRSPWPWAAACAALVVALCSTALWWHDSNLLSAMAKDLNEVRTEVAQRAASSAAASAAVAEALPSAVQSADGTVEATAASLSTGPGGPAQAGPNGAGPNGLGLGAVQGAAASGAAGPLTAAAGPQAPRRSALQADGKPLVLNVPYGSDAFGGVRLEAVRQVLDRLARQAATGVVDVKTFPGRFCLMGNSTDGYSVAPDETPYSKCDIVGNPADEALSPGQRTPVAFANLVGTVRNSTHGGLDVQVAQGDASVTATPYPPASAELTAGEWNRAAAANNRIEIRLH